MPQEIDLQIIQICQNRRVRKFKDWGCLDDFHAAQARHRDYV